MLEKKIRSVEDPNPTNTHIYFVAFFVDLEMRTILIIIIIIIKEEY